MKSCSTENQTEKKNKNKLQKHRLTLLRFYDHPKMYTKLMTMQWMKANQPKAYYWQYSSKKTDLFCK